MDYYTHTIEEKFYFLLFLIFDLDLLSFTDSKCLDFGKT